MHLASWGTAGMLAILSITPLSGCAQDSAPLSSTACYYKPLDISLIERELKARGVPFGKEGECLRLNGYHEELKAAELSAFGTPPPPGLNIRREDPSEVVNRLAEAGISSRIVTYAGMQYVAWDAADALRAEEVLNLLPEMREVMRRNREEQRSSE